MAERPSLARISTTLFVVLLLVLGSSTGSAAASRERYEPPTATAESTDLTGDNAALSPIEIEFAPND